MLSFTSALMPNVCRGATVALRTTGGGVSKRLANGWPGLLYGLEGRLTCEWPALRLRWVTAFALR